ncbi:hypothetical protein AgCh_032341 [Apium graveolens]
MNRLVLAQYKAKGLSSLRGCPRSGQDKGLALAQDKEKACSRLGQGKGLVLAQDDATALSSLRTRQRAFTHPEQRNGRVLAPDKANELVLAQDKAKGLVLAHDKENGLSSLRTRYSLKNSLLESVKEGYVREKLEDLEGVNKWVWDKNNVSLFGVKANVMNLLQDWRKALGESRKNIADRRVTDRDRSAPPPHPPPGWVKVCEDVAHLLARATHSRSGSQEWVGTAPVFISDAVIADSN